MERHDQGEARVVLIIVREVNCEKTPFAKLQFLPKDKKPVNNWSDLDKAWRNVVDGVEKVAAEFMERE